MDRIGGVWQSADRLAVSPLRALIVLAIPVVLAACTSSGGNQVENTLSPVQQQPMQMSGTDAAVPAPDPIQDPRAYCPKIVIRAGTETFDVYPKGVKKDDEGAAQKMLYRATVSEVARECNTAGSFLNIRVGVRGRYLSGPTGQTGAFTMPVRVAVTRGDEVLYSQLHEVPAEIPPGRTNGTFQYVDSAISIPKPEQEDIIIYAGFDEGPYNTP